jgi:hypothetical protein
MAKGQAGQAGRAHARHAADTGKYAIVQVEFALTFIARQSWVEPERQKMVLVKAQVYLLEALHAAEQQPGQNQDDERDGHLRHNEDAS